MTEETLRSGCSRRRTANGSVNRDDNVGFEDAEPSSKTCGGTTAASDRAGEMAGMAGTEAQAHGDKGVSRLTMPDGLVDRSD